MRAMHQAKALAMRQLVNRKLSDLVAGASEDRIIEVVRSLQESAAASHHKAELGKLITLLEEKHPAVDLARRVFTEASPACQRALVNNIGINSTFLDWPIRQARLEAGKAAPVLIVISPSMRCNLRCTGCYAWEYDRRDDLPFEVFDRVIREGKEIGIHFYTISGGEPFIRSDLLDIFAKHSDAEFLVYTNGTLIDRSMAQRLAELGNVGPAISIEGFQAETDARRGPGTWEKINRAMDYLREAGVIYGFSGTVTRHNADVITSEEMVDYLIGKGCYFGWYFMYIPIGRDPDISLMPTPEQRQVSRKRVWRWRDEKPIFVADFWNDGQFTGGCMAGGRVYLHVTASGDVEPCVFSHFTVDNIKEKSLEEVLASDFFKAMRRRFPWTDNLLAPCAIIDNPHVLREAVAEGGARPSHPGAETIITDLAPEIDAYAARMHEITAEDAKEVRCVVDVMPAPGIPEQELRPSDPARTAPKLRGVG